MRVPVYLVCAALAVAVRSEGGADKQAAVGGGGAAGGGAGGYLGRLLEAGEPLAAADPDALRYLLPKLAARYRLAADWSPVPAARAAAPLPLALQPDPRFYLYPELDSANIDNQMPRNIRNKRYEYRRSANPSLSIVAPIQTLRDAMSQARMRNQIQRNREFLQNLSSD